jgi:hypothetical protein
MLLPCQGCGDSDRIFPVLTHLVPDAAIRGNPRKVVA